MAARSISFGTRGTRETRKQAAGRLVGVMPGFSTLTTHPQRLLPVAALPFGAGGWGVGGGGVMEPVPCVHPRVYSGMLARGGTQALSGSSVAL